LRGRWRIGHFERAIPDGYEETLATGRNVIHDQEVARFYDRVTLIVAGPLWSRARLQAIVQMNAALFLDPRS